MHRLPFDQQVLLVIQTAALVGVFVRLWWTGLNRVYRYFFGYLIIELLQTVALASVPFYSNLYRDVWVATNGLIVCFYALIVLELYNVVLGDLAGIASTSRRYIKITLGLAILASLLLLSFEKAPKNMTGQYFIFERAVVSSLVVFVLLITAFLSYYPVPLNRNVVAYFIGYAVYFLTKAAAVFIRNVGYNWDRQMGTFFLIVYTGCLIFWMVALNRRGETRSLTIGHKWSPQEEERLLAQLKAINASLLRTARK